MTADMFTPVIRTLIQKALYSGLLFLFLHSSAQMPGENFLSSISLQNLSTYNGLSHGYINSVLQDKSGFLWVATKDGLNRYDGHSFAIYKMEKNGSSPASNNVRQIFEDAAGRLWITFFEGGLDLFDKETGEFQHVIPAGKSGKAPYPGKLDILGAGENDIVIIFNRNFYSIKAEKVPLYQQRNGKYAFCYKTNCKQLFPADGSGNFLWGNSAKISTVATGGIWMLDGNSSLFELKIYPERNQYRLTECIVPRGLTPPYRKKKSPPYYTVDHARNLVYFQQYGNIYRLNSRTGAVDMFMRNTAIESCGISVADANGDIWLSDKRGLYKMDVAQRKIYPVQSDNLKNEKKKKPSCHSTYADQADNIWVCTAGDGLLKISPGNRYFHHINGGASINSSAWKAGSSVNGNFSVVPPAVNSLNFHTGAAGAAPWQMQFAENVKSPYNPAVLITNVFVNGQYIAPWMGDLSLRHSLYRRDDKIELSHHQNELKFRFSSSDFTAPELNLFSYKLEGIDKNWSPPAASHEAAYKYLPPGNYIFRVRCTNRDRIWSRNELSFPFLIKVPWWQSWWFRSVVILSIAAGVYAVYRIRMNQLLKLQSIRNRISADMHDEIGSRLSSISFYTQALFMQSTDIEQKQVLMKIKDVAQAVQEELSDIVWNVKEDINSFDDILIRMQRVGNELLGSKNICLHFTAEEKRLTQKIKMRKNLYLIFKEALNNAAKYAQCRNVWVTIQAVHQGIRMKIRDDGLGFDPDKVKNGNGLDNMRQRAAAMNGELKISSVPGLGTEVTLTI